MHTRIGTLIIKQLKGEITLEEHAELNRYAAVSEDNRQLVVELTDPISLLKEVNQSYEWDIEGGWQEVIKGLPAPVISATWQRRSYSYLVAAVVLFVVVSLVWLFFVRKFKRQPELAEINKNSSGYYQALLKMSNGQVINLHEAKNGHLDQSEDPQLMKNDSQLLYSVNRLIPNPAINKLETPQKANYSVRLPDGSTVWLNSGSSLQFPNSFPDRERIVTVQGEAYFEIAKDPSKPFKLLAAGAQIQVTGTKFNVKAYKNDSTVRTTLVEGSVRIKAGNKTDSLKAGDQAILTKDGKIVKIKPDNAGKQALAWRENKFKWVHEDLKNIIGDISHWYGYDVHYRTNVSGITYSVTLNRSVSLDEILKILTLNTLLKFDIDYKTIIVYR